MKFECWRRTLCWLILVMIWVSLCRKTHGEENNIHPSTRSLENIEVRIKFEGKELVLSFPKTRLDAIEMASKLCHERFIDDEEDDARKNCIRKVGEYLIEQVEKKTTSNNTPKPSELDKTHVIQLTIQGRNYDLQLNPASDDFRTVAGEFCLKHYQSFNIQPEDINKYCVEAILQRLVETFPTKKTYDTPILPPFPSSESVGFNKVQVTLNIQNQYYTIDVDPQRHHNHEMAAEEFCQNFRHKFGLTDENFYDFCVVPISSSIDNYLRQQQQ